MIIKEVKARRILDSRNEPTIEVSVNGNVASSPSGKSTGKYESKPYFKSLETCIIFLNKWNDKTAINSFDDLKKIEKIICKKLKVSKPEQFGGNSLFAFESAILKAVAQSQKKELWQIINPRARTFPIPVGNAIGGGLHSAQFKVHPLFQEFLIIPREKSFSGNVDSMKEVYVSLGRALNASKVNDEGAWHVPCDDESVLKAMSQFGSSVYLGVDVASSTFFKNKIYEYHHTNRTPSIHVNHISELAKTYSLFYLEDPVQEEDFQGFSQVKKQVSDCLIVGDDLTATHLDRVKKAVQSRSINAVIVKPNQHGSLIHIKEIMEYCKKHKITTIMSHRSGETMDDSLGDYAFGFGANYLKAGISTKWREVKLNRLIEIENNL